MARDPVCGMTVTADSPHVHERDGQKFYFCCAGCKTRFAEAPEKYLERFDTAPMAITAQGSVPAAEMTGTMFTCPMHPEVRTEHPGACPKCGMLRVRVPRCVRWLLREFRR